MDSTKREQRQHKREIKRAGSQRRRRQWKRDLREDPEEAPYSEDDFGRFSTAELNGMDRDNTRRRDRSRTEPKAGDPREGPPASLALTGGESWGGQASGQGVERRDPLGGDVGKTFPQERLERGVSPAIEELE